MKYYLVSEQNLYDILVDLENCLLEHLERLEVCEEPDEYELPDCHELGPLMNMGKYEGGPDDSIPY